jgi:nicotinamidase-related amidase
MLGNENTLLMVIDVQGNLAHAMDSKESLFENLKKTIQGVQLLDIPIIVTEQYPTGLGHTIPEIASILHKTHPVISKVHFSCCGDETFMRVLGSLGRKQVLVSGIETHVCVYQTVMDLLQQGYEVEVLADAVSSRTAFNRDIGLAKMRAGGAGITSVEMALFELMKVAGGTTFKEIQKLVK